MKEKEIIETIKKLANSQGFYGRLYRTLIELDKEDYKKIITELENQNFNDNVDLVLYLES